MEQIINPKRCSGYAVAGGILLLIGELGVLGRILDLYLNTYPHVPLSRYLPELAICLIYIFFAITLMTRHRSFLQLIPIGLIVAYEVYNLSIFVFGIDEFGKTMSGLYLISLEHYFSIIAFLLSVLIILSLMLTAILSVMRKKHTLYGLTVFFTLVNLARSTYILFVMPNLISVPLFVFVQTNLFVSLGILFGAVGIGKPATEFKYQPGESGSAKGTYGYVSMGAHIVGLFFTFGIYLLIWIYRTTAALNRDESEPPRSPGAKLALCMFIPFYYIYWTYKSAQRIDRLSEKYGETSNMATICLILAIFIGFVPPILIQDKLNNIIEYENGKKSPIQNRPANVDAADELKKYKELLDAGAITQEEYEAKKAQLLNM